MKITKFVRDSRFQESKYLMAFSNSVAMRVPQGVRHLRKPVRYLKSFRDLKPDL